MPGTPLTTTQRRHFQTALLSWFDQNKRDLPWRRTRDAYAIWVSEIMLQQTRVAAVLDHYARWMERFPTVTALAEAEEPEVLALWSGLGYYRRARFLHAGAKTVLVEQGGQLPTTAETLRPLPGIGEYTSAAIASIAFGEPVAVVDGNVERVVMRLAGLALAMPADPLTTSCAKESLPAATLGRQIRLLANELLARERPGDANQAMMELGATVCLPRAPLCLHCPVLRFCHTRGEHTTAPRKTMQTRSIAYTLIERVRGVERDVLLVQRAPDASLMASMWELPETVAGTLPHSAAAVERETASQSAEEPARKPASRSIPVPARPPSPSIQPPVRTGPLFNPPNAPHRIPLLTLRHAITVTNYQVSILAPTQEEANNLAAAPSARWIPTAQLPALALTGLARKALKRLALWPENPS